MQSLRVSHPTFGHYYVSDLKPYSEKILSKRKAWRVQYSFGDAQAGWAQRLHDLTDIYAVSPSFRQEIHMHRDFTPSLVNAKGVHPDTGQAKLATMARIGPKLVQPANSGSGRAGTPDRRGDRGDARLKQPTILLTNVAAPRQSHLKIACQLPKNHHPPQILH